MSYQLCEATINLGSPVRRERVRGFQPPWRTVFVYKCATCGQERRVYANSFRGPNPVPGIGAIRCGAYIATNDATNEPARVA